MQTATYSPASFSSFIMRLFAGIGGGLLGTSAALLVLILFSYAQNSSEKLGGVAEFSGAGILAIAFAGSLIGNLFAIFFHTLADPRRYSPRNEVMRHVFSVNIFLFLASLPFYLLSVNGEHLLMVAAIHFFLSASASLLAAEMVAGKEYGIIAIIAVSMVELFVLVIYFFLPVRSGGPMLTILFLPFVWILLPCMVFIVEKIRSGVWKMARYDIFEGKK